MAKIARYAHRAFEDLTKFGPLVAMRSAAYIVGGWIGKDSFDVNLPWGRFSVPANRRKLGVGGYIYSRRERYESELQPYFSQCRGAFLDVGANFGYWTCFVAHQAGVSSIVAFEPEPSNFQFLRKNVAALCNEIDVQLVPAALGSVEKNASLCASNDDPGSFFVGVGGTQIKQMKFDTWTASQNIDRIGLIKIDVEGYEYEVLSGAVEAICEHKPVIICELIRRYLARNKRTPEDVFRLLSGLGYSAKYFNGSEIPCAQFVEDGDYVFSPAK
jgi:FkbM family methyltransferase